MNELAQYLEAAPESIRRRFALRWAVPLAGVVVVLAIGKGFVDQMHQLYWRPSEVTRAVSSLVGLITLHPWRAAGSFVLMVVIAAAAEASPVLLRRFVERFWIAAGLCGAVAYVASALDVAYHVVLVATVAAAAVAVGVSTIADVHHRSSRRRADERLRARDFVPAVLVGLSLGVILLRASLEVVTEWDAIVYHASFARDWMTTLPHLPPAAGPSLGAEMSYSYPALYSAVAVATAKGLGLGIVDVLRWIPPLAAASVVVVSRALISPRRAVLGWTAAGLMLASPLFVNYAQWPTTYALSTLFVFLIFVEVWSRGVDGRPLVLAALVGLLAVAGMLGLVFALALVGVYVARAAIAHYAEGRVTPGPRVYPLVRVAQALLLVAPIAGVVAASLRRAHALFFPWITWPGGQHLLPAAYWKAAQQEVVSNSYGEYGTAVGALWSPFEQIVRHALLFPGGPLLLALAGALLAAPSARRRSGAAFAVFVVGVALLVAAQLVWIRYFVAVVPVLCVVTAWAVASGGAWAHNGRLRATGVALVVALACGGLVYGTSLGLAGPNDFTFTELLQLEQSHVSAFDRPRDVTNVDYRLKAVFGDDARAWSDVRALTRAGIKVGTFDVRNFYVPYTSTVQLDGLAGSTIPRGSGRLQVIARLRALGVGAVYIPSWVWDPSAPALVNPLVHWSPVTEWVGAPGLRAVRTYVDDRGHLYPSVIYAVGGDVRRIEQVLQGTADFSAWGDLAATIGARPGELDVSDPLGPHGWFRMAAPAVENYGPILRLRVRVASGSGLSVYEPSTVSAFQPEIAPACSTAPARQQDDVLDVEMPGSALGFSVLDVSAPHARGLTGTIAQRTRFAGRQLQVAACGDPASRRGAYFPAGGRYGRLGVLHATGRDVLSFEYRDSGQGQVTFNALHTISGRWSYDVAGFARCGTGRWLHTEVAVPSYGAAVGEIAPVVQGRSLEIRNLRVLPAGTAPAVQSIVCGDPTTSTGAYVPAGTTVDRFVVARTSAHAVLRFSYLDVGRSPVTFNLWQPSINSWVYGVGSVDRCNTGRWVDATIPLPKTGHTATTVLAPVVARPAFRLRDLRVEPAYESLEPTALACGDLTSRTGGLIRPGTTMERLVLNGRGRRLSFDYLDTSGPPVTFNALDVRTGRWLYDVAALARCGTGRWIHAEIPSPLADQASVQLGPVVRGSPLPVRMLGEVDAGTAPYAYSASCGGIFPAGDRSTRIFVANRGASDLLLDFDYRDGNGAVSFNALDGSTGKWSPLGAGAVERCGSGAWLHAAIPVPFAGQGTIQLGPSVQGDALETRDLTVVPAPRGPFVAASACGDPTGSTPANFPSGVSSGRLTVLHRRSGPLSLVFDYLDSAGSVSFNVFDAKTRTWRFGVAKLERGGTGTWKRAVIQVPFPGRDSVVFGPVVAGDPLSVRAAHVVPASR
ncbi:MAG TPA: hypothetical protein VFW41_10095 [Gaiellaceae bacterium]|nr:hypothetical protein [Gaiellaceae bacterium]